ncbi:glycosyltransferase [Puniceicoccales bacterium CK1056]|uniref:Glycosyltransferase n=1 Tax=Oceanipulchritudo coccoides TaxID=2706888 RepID=A0A6B2M2M5_9BACT|nr:glycosyltransferase [Oceanipulchritudo coccoides]NDV62327.1 glycosyltransferase [Oceanipulchritudo coccoides]
MKSNTSTKARVLYCAEASSGGIAEYVKFHSLALVESGLAVTILCREDYPHKKIPGVSFVAELPAKQKKASSLMRVLDYISDSRTISRKVLDLVTGGGYDYVLLDCFREYLSPFWVGPLKKARAKGIRFGVVAHDPVRDFVVGPHWWHSLSIRMAYSFIDDVYVHDSSRIDFGRSHPETIRIHEIPHGPYEISPPIKGREIVREEMGFQKDDQVCLSFGQIRDGKNLDLFLRAMTSLPESVKLLVAGKSDSGSQKTPEYYQNEARERGVDARCQWLIKYINEDEIADLFAASDLVLLTYSKAFVSASGVLNIAVECAKPVLASGGAGPLKTAVSNYPIGEWIEDLNEESVASAVTSLLKPGREFHFAEYADDHSWKRNAATVKDAIVRKTDED